MPKKTFTVAEVPGSKRTSDANYTHAIIGQADPALTVALWRANRNAAREIRENTKDWKLAKLTSSLKEGDLYINHNNCRVPVRQYTIDSSVQFITENPTLEGYLAAREKHFEDECASTLAKPVGPVVVLRWSRSAVNAAKAVAEFSQHYSNLRVVPVVRTK
jgi:hypothetical protein